MRTSRGHYERVLISAMTPLRFVRQLLASPSIVLSFYRSVDTERAFGRGRLRLRLWDLAERVFP